MDISLSFSLSKCLISWVLPEIFRTNWEKCLRRWRKLGKILDKFEMFQIRLKMFVKFSKSLFCWRCLRSGRTGLSLLTKLLFTVIFKQWFFLLNWDSRRQLPILVWPEWFGMLRGGFIHFITKVGFHEAHGRVIMVLEDFSPTLIVNEYY